MSILGKMKSYLANISRMRSVEDSEQFPLTVGQVRELFVEFDKLQLKNGQCTSAINKCEKAKKIIVDLISTGNHGHSMETSPLCGLCVQDACCRVAIKEIDAMVADYERLKFLVDGIGEEKITALAKQMKFDAFGGACGQAASTTLDSLSPRTEQ